MISAFLRSRPKSDFLRFYQGSCSEKNPAYINHIVLCETAWVLERYYGVNKDKFAGILEKILKTEPFSVQKMELVWRALRELKKTGADFADCLFGQINLANGCDYTVTVDKKASVGTGYRGLG